MSLESFTRQKWNRKMQKCQKIRSKHNSKMEFHKNFLFLLFDFLSLIFFLGGEEKFKFVKSSNFKGNFDFLPAFDNTHSHGFQKSIRISFHFQSFNLSFHFVFMIASIIFIAKHFLDFVRGDVCEGNRAVFLNVVACLECL
jgi:hypothetical protein